MTRSNLSCFSGSAFGSVIKSRLRWMRLTFVLQKCLAKALLNVLAVGRPESTEIPEPAKNAIPDKGRRRAWRQSEEFLPRGNSLGILVTELNQWVRRIWLPNGNHSTVRSQVHLLTPILA